MRTIQFRCFYRGVMYPVKEMQFDTDGSFSVSIIEMDLDGLGVRDVSPDSEHVEGLMQFTGLHDKNGKEIFEGDLVNYKYLEGEKAFEVIFDEDVAAFKIAKDEYYMGFLGDKKRHEIEVIGNRYEHKHLLK